MRYYYTPIRTANVKNIWTIASVDKDAEQLEYLHIVGGIQNDTVNLENGLAAFHQDKCTISIWSSYPTPEHLREMKS